MKKSRRTTKAHRKELKRMARRKETRDFQKLCDGILHGVVFNGRVHTELNEESLADMLTELTGLPASGGAIAQFDMLDAICQLKEKP